MGSVRRGLCIMAKHPAPGQVKTRLCPPLNPEQAAEFAEAFLHDTLANCRKAARADLALAYTPLESEAWFAARFPGVALLPQMGVGLGERLVNLFALAWKRRYQPCVVLGSDSPDLSSNLIQAAFDALEPGRDSADVVLGPTEDGGYYLIGLKWAQPELFRHVAWSTDQVLNQTLERATTLQLKTCLLPAWYDIDTHPDLTRLRAGLLHSPPETCPAARKVFEKYPGLGAAPQAAE
jgi:rSAM/selenodomain-associated transferase 1